ncbi:MAG: hypothetical protein WC982_09680 [Advenella sp.]
MSDNQKEVLELSKQELYEVLECGIQIILRAWKFSISGHSTLKGHIDYCHGDNFTDDFLHWSVNGDIRKEDNVRSFLIKNKNLVEKLLYNTGQWPRL